MSLFQKNKIYPAGLDISDSSMKLVQLNKDKKGKIGLRCFGRIDLPKEVIVGGEIKDEETVVKKLKELFSNCELSHPNSDHIVASLPEGRTFIKLIKVKDVTNKLEDIIETEMEKHIPYSSQDVYYDWQVIEKKKDHRLILIAVAPKGLVEQYYSVFGRAGLVVEALEVEPIAICRAVLEEETPVFEDARGKNYIVIDIGASHSTIIFYSRNTILFTTETQLSGNKITEEIADELNVNKDKAEKYKISMNKKNKNYKKIVKIINGNLEELNIKLGRAVDFYYENFSDRGPLESVFLVGGGSYTQGVSDAIDCLPASVNIEKANPLFKVSRGKKAKKIFREEENSLCFTTAVGLALNRIFIKE